MIRQHGASKSMQVCCAPIIAEAGPCVADAFRARGGQMLDGGEAVEEAVPVAFDPGDLGLLQHHFGHEHLVRIAGAAPRQVPAMLAEPRHETALEAEAVRPRIGDGLGAHRRTR